MRKRLSGIIIAIEFLVMMIVPLATFNWKQGVESKAEKRVLTAFPTIIDSEGNVSETLLYDTDKWFKDNIGLRDPLIYLSSIINFNFFHKSTSDKVEIGKDGWLFYAAENNLRIANNTYPDFGEEKLELFCNQIIKAEKRLKDQGRELVLVLPASKVSIYPEYIQSGDYGIIETPADRVANYLENHSSIKVIRLKDVMLEAKSESDKLLYFKTDTHWNEYGRYLGYKAIIYSLNKWGIIDTGPIEASFHASKSPFSGDMAVMMGKVTFDGRLFSEEFVPQIELNDPQASHIDSGDRYKTYVDKYGLASGSMWENNSLENGRKLLVYGDSMFRCIINFLAENFAETTFVWSYQLEQSRIDFLDPDVIILDISERGLTDVLPGAFDSFLKTNVIYQKADKKLDVFYYDEGKYSTMFFPTWSEANGQDDLVWYEAKRIDNDSWYVQVDLAEHSTDGLYHIHFYDGPSGSNPNCVFTMSYNVGKIN